MSGPRVGVATARDAAAVDEDMAPFLTALATCGATGVAAVWDDPAQRWDAYDAVVLRSTWDYVPRLDAFLAWAGHVAAVTVLLNPLPVVTWNTDKRYLFDLAAAGVPIVPTRLFEPGDRVVLPDPATEVVVKPAVSAGSRDTDRYPPERAAAAIAHAEALLDAGRAVLVQPYQPSVDRIGERAVVHLDGSFSHAVTKGPLLLPETAVVAGLYAEERIDPAVATPAERAVATAAVEFVTARFGTPVYARVDLVDGPDGPCVLELELTEPSLFLDHGPGSADRLAAAVLARLRA